MSKRITLTMTLTLVLTAASAPVGAAYYYPSSNPYFVRLLGPTLGLAGRDLNGIDLNGRLLDGRFVVAVSLDGVTRNGKERPSVSLLKTRFAGVAGLYSNNPNQSVDVRFRAELDDGSFIELRVDSAQRHPDSIHHDVTLYEVSYATDLGWQPLCGQDEDGAPLGAVPLNGRWSYAEGVPWGGSWIDDPDAFTFACVNRVLAKCVLAGYKPWRKALVCGPEQGCHLSTLASHHQACTRAMRADYCGDGVSHTEDGMEINFFDDLGVRLDSAVWPIEAEWNADGALCAVAERLDSTTPWCMQDLYDASCGQLDHFDDGTLLITEYDAP